MARFFPLKQSQEAMLAPEQLLARYEQLLVRATRMLDCAQLGHWTELLSEESCYVEEVAQLAGLAPDRELERPELERRLDLMERILECNLQVKRHLVTRMDEIGELISLSKRQGELGRSYGVIDSIDKPDLLDWP